jgi:hypothetical protein
MGKSGLFTMAGGRVLEPIIGAVWMRISALWY